MCSTKNYKKTNEEKKKLFSKSEFFCKLPDWKRWAIFHYTKAKRTLISVKSQPLEKRKNSFATLELYCQASPRLDFNFYPIVRLQNKTWCVLVLLLPLCLSVLFIWQEKKLSSRFETIIRLLLRKKRRQNHQFIAIVDCVPKKVDLSVSLTSLFLFLYTLQGWWHEYELQNQIKTKSNEKIKNVLINCVSKKKKEKKKRPAAVQRFYLMMPKNDPKDIDVLHKNAAALNLVLV